MSRTAIPIEAHQAAQIIVGAAAAIVGCVSAEEINGRSRRANVHLARQAVAVVLKRQGWSYPEIGIALNRDHSTIYHNLVTAERLLTYDHTLARLVADLEAGVTEPVSIFARIESMEQRIAFLEALLTPHRRTA